MYKIKLSSIQNKDTIGLSFTLNMSSLDQFKDVVLENVEHLKVNETIQIEVTKL